MPKKLFVIDAMAMAFRNHYAFGMRPLTTSDGKPTSAVFGSAMFMNKLLSEYRPDYVVVATDTKEPTFRHEMYKEYKANRDAMPEDLAAQLPDFFRLFDCYGIPVIRMPGFEADDIIGSIAVQKASKDLEIYMVSGDKDFLQLVNDQVFLLTPKKGSDAAVIDANGVVAKFGVNPDQVIDLLAIMGDSADNVPGVKGIGEKGAAKLIQTYGTLDGIYENLDKITAKRQLNGLTDYKKEAYLSRDLVTIKTDITLDMDLEACSLDPESALNNPSLISFFKELEFHNLAKKLEDGSSAAPAVSNEAPAPQAAAAAGSASSNYELVDTKAKLAQFLEGLKQAEVFCFDTETTGLNIIQDHPIGISLSYARNHAAYLPLVEKHLGDITPDEVVAACKEILEDDSYAKVGHNIKYDVQMLSNIGIQVVGPFCDTMIEDHLLNATAKSHGLDACCLRHLNYEKIPTSALIGKKGEISMLDVPLDELTRYACEDADQTLQLHNLLYPQLETENLLAVYHHVEEPLIPIIAKMEQEGIYIDCEELTALSDRMEKLAADLTTQIHDLAGCDFNIKSPKQLGEVMFEKLKIHEALGVTKLKKTKTGFSTNEAVLNLLAEHPLPRAVLEYRGITKLKSTYVDVLPTLVNETTGRVHTSFHQVGTSTGRLSSSDPNLQNIPIRSDLGKEIRKAFKPQNKNNLLISADYSQVELRMLAHIAEEEVLTEAFRQGADVHTTTAARIFGVKPEEVDGTLRSRAKAINFGIIYGMGPKRLSTETGVTMKEASSFIKKYLDGYPKIKHFIDSAKDKARETEMTYSITGRRRPVPAINGKDRMLLAAAENIAVNTPIQGSAADLIKLAMSKLQKQILERGLKSRMLLQVHDELVFEVPADEAEEITQLIKESMESAMALKVPLKVDIGSGDNWLEAH